jgi:hypothetical protein
LFGQGRNGILLLPVTEDVHVSRWWIDA